MLNMEFTGKTVQKAIEEGLRVLNKTIDEVDIKIVSQGGLFRKAKILITSNEPEKEVKPALIREEKPVVTTFESDESAKQKKAEASGNNGANGAVNTKKAEQSEGDRSNNHFDRQAKQQQPAASANNNQNNNQNGNKQNNNQNNNNNQKNQSNNNQNKSGGGKQPMQNRNQAPARPQLPKFEGGTINAPASKKPADSQVQGGSNQNNQNNQNNTLSQNTQNAQNNNQKNQGSKQPAPKNHPEKNNQTAKPEKKEPAPHTPITPEVTENAHKYLSGLLEKMNITSDVTCKNEGDELVLNIESETGAVIGYRGETLDALELLTILSVAKGCHYKIAVNSSGYRERRQETLVTLAKRKAERVIRTGRKEILEPMSSNARRLIHDALSDNDKVVTKSDGNEPNRYIVIYPKGGRDRKERFGKDGFNKRRDAQPSAAATSAAESNEVPIAEPQN